ncbi:hypothetical protein MNBD_GAMMA22-2880 [hydrothermal vent metagenome]|uniref:Uncharacterized protein n=1 Tax=hydrothermal vent metagenome TaxID=652676 RepID=A0A3B1ADG9_9ZZZZ
MDNLAHKNLNYCLKEFFSIPRQVILHNIDLEHCPHCGRFDINDTSCTACIKKHDCFWLYKNDHILSNGSKPLVTQKAALDFAIGFVSEKIDEWQHNENSCPCYVCEWLQHAKDISDDLNETIEVLY